MKFLLSRHIWPIFRLLISIDVLDVASAAAKPSPKAAAAEVRRREIPHFVLHRRNFIALFYGVSEIFHTVVLTAIKPPINFIL